MDVDKANTMVSSLRVKKLSAVESFINAETYNIHDAQPVLRARGTVKDAYESY